VITKTAQAARALGLHPIVAISMILVDAMLFPADATGVGWLASVAVAIALTIPCVLMQRYAYKDPWTLAVSKGLIVGILTAIPTPLPSIATGAGGLAGLIGTAATRKTNKEQSHLDTNNPRG